MMAFIWIFSLRMIVQGVPSADLLKMCQMYLFSRTSLGRRDGGP